MKPVWIGLVYGVAVGACVAWVERMQHVPTAWEALAALAVLAPAVAFSWRKRLWFGLAYVVVLAALVLGRLASLGALRPAAALSGVLVLGLALFAGWLRVAAPDESPWVAAWLGALALAWAVYAALALVPAAAGRPWSEPAAFVAGALGWLLAAGGLLGLAAAEIRRRRRRVRPPYHRPAA